MRCHSERSEESLFGLDPSEERFLASLGMTTQDNFSASGRTAGDGRHDADRVAILSWRIFLVQETNILVVQVHIHEAANFPFLGEEMLPQLGKRTRQAAERLA